MELMSLLGEEHGFSPRGSKGSRGYGNHFGTGDRPDLRRLSVDGTTTLHALSGVLKDTHRGVTSDFHQFAPQQFVESKGWWETIIASPYRGVARCSPPSDSRLANTRERHRLR